MGEITKKTDVIVLGVGGMGSAACYQLAKRGVRVLGLEQFQIGHDRGSSHGQTRMVRQAYFEHPNYVPLLKRAYELWNELSQISGQKLFHQIGLIICSNPQKTSLLEQITHSADLHGISIEHLDQENAIRKYPYFTPPSGYQAIFEPAAGYVEVERSVQSHAKLARKEGALIYENEAVQKWSVSKDTVQIKTENNSYEAKKIDYYFWCDFSLS